MRFHFEDYSLDAERRELRRGTTLIALAPQVFDLLEYLVRNRDHVVSKDDLIEVIWEGRIVSDAALTTRLNILRKAIGDSGDNQRLIRTLPRKGVRFVGHVSEVGATNDHPGSRSHVSRLSIVVLPFINVSGNPGQEYVADGITECLVTDLSRLRNCIVIGAQTSLSFKGKSISRRQIGRDLNVRYVLEGSLQRAAGRLRINVQLVDAETEATLWAERFDKRDIDLFVAQDEIVSRLANTLNTELIRVEAHRAARSTNWDATDLIFQGMASLNKGPSPENLKKARAFFEGALAIDPTNIEALVGKAQVHVSASASLISDNRLEELTNAEAILAGVLSMAPSHAFAHVILGLVHIVSGRPEQGIAECEQALLLDRNLAHSHGLIGLGKIFLGQPLETEAHVVEALRLSPRDTRAHLWMMFAGTAKLHLGQDVEALAWLRRSIESNRNHPLCHFRYAAALALVGRHAEARAAAQAGLALDPGFTLRRYSAREPIQDSAYLAGRERIFSGMRAAGLAE